MSQAPDIRAAAVRYAQRGWPILPVSSSKAPLISDWPNYATADSAIIRDWWEKFPNAGVGIVTGSVSGLVVLDIDGARGETALAGLEERQGKLPPTYAVRTGGGGRHLYFAYPHDQLVRNSAGALGLGLDIRGDGGFVVAPPSMHQSGSRYLWVMNGRNDPAALPDWLLKLICERPDKTPVPSSGTRKICKGQRNSELTSLAGTMRKRGMTPEAIEAALLAENQRRCEPPLEEREVQRVAASIGRYQPAPDARATVALAEEVHFAQEDVWPDPAPLGDEPPPVPALDLELLPVSLRPLIEDVSERMQAPPEYAAVAAVVSLAGCVGRRAAIMPKVQDTGWVVVPNLWGAIIAPPGFMKSPMLCAITQPLTKIEDKWREKYESRKAEFEVEKEVSEIQHQAWKEDFKLSIKKGKERPPQPEEALSPPAQQRLVLTDATFEKLHEILAQNPAGVLVIRDELTGWLAELDRLGREGERAFFLTSWNGDSGFTVDRIGRGSIYVPAVCVSLHGNIQPARLRWYLGQALEGGPSDDGLFQRFQVIVWPNPPQNWRLVDRPPNQAALQTAEHVFSRLADLSADDPIQMHFAPDAQKLFFSWLTELENKIRSGIGLLPVLIAHLAKYRSLMPSLAGLFRLADCMAMGGDLDERRIITLDDARRAAAWCDFLESHAHRVYSCAITPELRAAHELARRLKAGNLPSPFTTRSIYLKGWAGLDTPDRVRVALELLEEAAWVCLVPTERSAKGGRPSEIWMVNPRVGAK